MNGSGEGAGVDVFLNNPAGGALPEELVESGIRAALEAEEVERGELSLTFLDDAGITSLNREHLGRDRTTDVIAFALHEAGEPPLGDIYVGYDQARRQSEELGVSLEEELLRLAIHGTLHVLGYDHPEGEGRTESPMFRRQEALVRAVLDAPEDSI